MDNSKLKKILARDKIAQVYLGEWGSDAFQQRTRDRINWFVDQIDHGTVLDIGCSEGILPILLGRKGIDVIGVDINPESIEYANNLLLNEESTVANHVTFICDDFINSDWSDNTYDTVIIGEIIEHFENPEIIINKAIKQLKLGALLLVTTPYGYFPDPDHRYSFSLISFLEFFPKDSLMPLSLTVVDGYIRFSAKRLPAEMEHWDAIKEKLLPISEEAILNIQKIFHNQINDMVKVRQELYATIRQLREQISNNAKELNCLRKSINSFENEKQRLENEKQRLENEKQRLENEKQRLE
ncbi:MAG: methyltransferase domain-containing protein, partial [Anaerolineales bacterium]|nr:methyltransferase domain-containing protein [Anaerolineales bacterium]